MLQPEHSCSRRPASVAPDRLRHLRGCGTLVSGGSDADRHLATAASYCMGAPRRPAAHGAQRERLQAQVLQAGLRQRVRGDALRGFSLKACDGSRQAGQNTLIYIAAGLKWRQAVNQQPAILPRRARSVSGSPAACMRREHGRRRARAHLGQVPVDGLQQGLHAAHCCLCLALALVLLECAHSVLRQARGCAQRAGARERQGQRGRNFRQLYGEHHTG